MNNCRNNIEINFFLNLQGFKNLEGLKYLHNKYIPLFLLLTSYFLICIPSFLISQTPLDQLEYTYNTNTNQLNYIKDAIGASISSIDLDNQSISNYTYNANGQLAADVAEGILNIEWTVAGKVKQVIIDDSDPLDGVADRTLQFKYDAMGNRVKKIETDLTTHNPQLTTYYIRNAMGELISIYKDEGSEPKRNEIEITDGSDNIASLTSVSKTEFERKVGFKNYELNDHLNNVRVVISDTKEPKLGLTTYNSQLTTSLDYYSYGMLMPGRDYKSSDYGWGYQRKEKDDELKGNGNSYDFGARLLDPRLGRWLSIDPLASKFPDESPYAAMGNNPINMVDQDGKEYESQIALKWIDYLRIYHADEYDIVEMYNVYVNPSVDVEEQIYIDFMDMVHADVASGEFQATRRMQLKDFREKRKGLAPIETLIPVREIVIYEPDPTPVIPTTVETPDYLVELFKPIDDLVADPYGFKEEEITDLISNLTVPIAPRQRLINSIDELTKQIEIDKRMLEMLNDLDMPNIQPNIDHSIKKIAEGEMKLEEKRKELENFNELDEVH